MIDQDNIPPKISTINPKENCSKCKFWIRSNDSPKTREGLCRRFPPQQVNLPVAIENGIAWKATILFPPMMDYGWCGEFRPKNMI